MNVRQITAPHSKPICQRRLWVSLTNPRLGDVANLQKVEKTKTAFALKNLCKQTRWETPTTEPTLFQPCVGVIKKKSDIVNRPVLSRLIRWTLSSTQPLPGVWVCNNESQYFSALIRKHFTDNLHLSTQKNSLVLLRYVQRPSPPPDCFPADCLFLLHHNNTTDKGCKWGELGLNWGPDVVGLSVGSQQQPFPLGELPRGRRGDRACARPSDNQHSRGGPLPAATVVYYCLFSALTSERP